MYFNLLPTLADPVLSARKRQQSPESLGLNDDLLERQKDLRRKGRRLFGDAGPEPPSVLVQTCQATGDLGWELALPSRAMSRAHHADGERV